MIIPHGSEDGLSELLAPTSSTGKLCRVRAAAISSSTEAGILTSLRNRMLRPGTLQLLALGIAIALWGSYYKLSLYNPHPTPPSRSVVAKLWVGPRPAVIAQVTGPKSKAPSNFSIPVTLIPPTRHASPASGDRVPTLVAPLSPELLAFSAFSRPPPPKNISRS